MTSLDTNLLVRVVTNDDPVQARRAARLMREGRLWLSKTVLLETEWVLRHAYGYSAAQLNGVLGKLIRLERLEVEDADAVEVAVEWHAGGLDFADALHLASSRKASRFATFDRGLAKAAARCRSAPTVRLV